MPPPDEPLANTSRQQHTLQKSAEEAKQRGLHRLMTLLEHADPVELFVATATSKMFGLPEELTEANFGAASVRTELLAYELYPHFGRTPASSKRESVKSTTLQLGDVEACHKAVDELLFSHMFQAFRISEYEKGEIIGLIRGRAAVVRGNAYPPQTERRIREVQGRFDQWYLQRVGIAPNRAIDALQSIVKAMESAYNSAAKPAAAEVATQVENRWQAIHESPKHKRDANDAAFIQQFHTRAAARRVGFTSALEGAAFRHVPAHCPSLEPALTDSEWKALLSLIGFTNQEREKMQEPVEVRKRPLYVLPDGRVLFVNFSHVFDALWDAFDAAARQDSVFYDTRYQRHAANWLEGRVVTYLRKLFPDGTIYKTLDYSDPAKARGATAELDVAVLWGPFLLIVEAKAKQFRLAGQLGDVGRLRTDLKQNLEEAFDQALRARKYIDSTERPIFKERGTGRELVLHKARFLRVYPLTVSLHQLATLTTRLTALESLGLFKGNEYPFAICEGDLEILSELCPGPEVFLHYVEKRIALHRVTPHVSGDEVDLLGAYLDTRFVSKQLWDNPKNRMTNFSLDGYSDRIDKWAQYHWNGIGDIPEIQLDLPEGIPAVLSHLRSMPEHVARWIAFCLLDLPYGALAACVNGLKKARIDPPKYGSFRRFVAAADDVVNLRCSLMRSFTARSFSKRGETCRY